MSVFTSDGLNLYFYALTAHFGEWVRGRSEAGRRVCQWVVAWQQEKWAEVPAKPGMWRVEELSTISCRSTLGRDKR